MSEPLEYRGPGPRRRLRPWVIVVSACLLCLLGIGVVLPSLNRTHEHSAWISCSSNLKQIGQAMLLYANENRDQMPPDFVALLQTQDLVPEVFACWGAGDEKTTATQPAEQRADFAGGGHCSYIYVDRLGRYSKIAYDDIVAFEPPGHHDFAAALFGDGHTERIDDATAKELLRQYNHAVRPIRLPAR